MKNIFLISTDKPSCLSIIDGQLIFSHQYFVNPQHLYITSDSNIGEGFSDWFIGQGGFEKKSIGTDIINGETYLLDYLGNTDKAIWCKKIILTTDPQLIEQGIQAIDDEFLEWFINNSSCEEVKVYYDLFEYEKDSTNKKYIIIIPREKPKQETLEEAVENYVKDSSHELYELRKTCFEDGANWQRDKSYNYEDMRKCWDASIKFKKPVSEGYAPNFNEFIEQLKNR